MCYYARTDYDCRDWKWGNMMLRCPRQHRIGETCGAKLVHSESVTKGGPLCKICEEVEIKKRRYSKTCDNIQRWAKEPDKFTASLEKAQREARELGEKIKELHFRRPSVASSLNVQATPPTANMLPPISMTTMTMTTTTTTPTPRPTSGYEYASPQANLGRRQEPLSMSQPRTSMTTHIPMTNGMTYSQMQSPNTTPKYNMQVHVPTDMTMSWDSKAYSMTRR